jgi:glycosyltransferase involved in cell wall biosynthesis
MEPIWDQAQVLLMPSLWCEAWGLVVVEAQIRGIPVISSDAGAIPEAKLNLPYIIPVRELTSAGDKNGPPTPPPQNVSQWVDVLKLLMTDRREYERLSDLCRMVTSEWVQSMDLSMHEKWLLGRAE